MNLLAHIYKNTHFRVWTYTLFEYIILTIDKIYLQHALFKQTMSCL